MHWYLTTFTKNYANFSGRAGRSEFWFFALFNFIVLLLLAALGAALGGGIRMDGSGINPVAELPYFLYVLVAIIPSLAISVRRLHDTGKTGWWLLLGLIPVAGLILLVFYCLDSDRGANKYGPDPRDAAATVSAH